MATLEDIRDQIVNSGIILNKRRHHRLVDAMKLVSSAIDRGSHIFEVAVSSKADVEDLRKIKASFPEAVVGAGSLSQIELMKDSLYAGADFFVSPHSDAAMINFAKEKSVFYVPGGASPNELWQLAQSNPDMQNWYTGKNIAAYQLEDLKDDEYTALKPSQKLQNGFQFVEYIGKENFEQDNASESMPLSTGGFEVGTSAAKFITHGKSRCLRDLP